MDYNLLPDNPYILLTPGPLSTTKSVKASMFRDWCTWDSDYNDLIQDLRKKLIEHATRKTEIYTSVLMQGSGTFGVEAVIGSMVGKGEKILILTNGAYGDRMVKIAKMLNLETIVQDSGELAPPDLTLLEDTIKKDTKITHVAVVHTETTTGMLNPVKAIGEIVKKYNRTYFVDAMSSFGGIEFDIDDYFMDFTVSSANKCIQGVPGFGFILAKKDSIKKCKGQARSLSLDIYDQWETMEKFNGKWRYTSPTHVVRAFYQALLELEEEGGIPQRAKRYKENQAFLVKGMEELGFSPILPRHLQSPIITSFYSPTNDKYEFMKFYQSLKGKGFVIYPGKVTELNTFRIGNIGDVHKEDIVRLLTAIKDSIYW